MDTTDATPELVPGGGIGVYVVGTETVAKNEPGIYTDTDIEQASR